MYLSTSRILVEQTIFRKSELSFGMATELTVDNVFSSVKQLQHEKNCLEEKLRSLQSQRSALETRVGELSTKESQVKETHHKMSETLKVAQDKVAQTRVKGEEIEMKCQKMRDNLTDINRYQEERREQSMEDINDFETRMNGLAESFKHGRKFYTSTNLTEEVSKTIQTISSLKRDKEEHVKKVDEIGNLLANLELEKDNIIDAEIPKEQQELVIDLLQEDSRHVRSFLENMMAKKSGLLKELGDLKHSDKETN